MREEPQNVPRERGNMPTIREIRESRGWSQGELSHRSGFGVNTISRLENGEEVLRSTLVAICTALGVSVDEITGANIVNRVRSRTDGKAKM